MTQEHDHPITPPPELVNLLRSEAPHGIRDACVTRELYLITAAYRAGADQELEASCEQLRNLGFGQRTIDSLRAFRRPKPPSLKEQSLRHLEVMERDGHYLPEIISDLRRAIESLPS